jgi:hypothetical protein
MSQERGRMKFFLEGEDRGVGEQRSEGEEN